MRRYNQWSGNPKGTPEDPTDCIASVRKGPWHCGQCSRRRGHGKDGLWCKQHSKGRFWAPPDKPEKEIL